MRQIPEYAEWTGYVVWLALAGALLSKTADILIRFADERRRRLNASRLAGWKPPPRTPDPGHDVTRVLPGIQRPKGP